ncbi:neuraminidase-like domain-containing protein [Pseudomonas sp. Teo4]|uniref:Tc toxin subunit A-related protein n=1 Tax=Pseudomonas sp. Teo4 TaxID=3064528 RepID=UPI002ABC4183|nr:neuraminidase-like domain-containing protein [Pseudomonas sp. Teo4]MDZ3991198.1 hypothetical protein [Pseudomonas sp. Teo4]
MQKHHEIYESLIEKVGGETVACLGKLSVDELREHLDESIDEHEAQVIHDELRKACDQELLDTKNAMIRTSPLAPDFMRTNEVVEEIAQARLDVDELPALDENWQQPRAQQFSAPGNVASMFSPAAYLSELYQQAKGLYPAGNPWHIDRRRPDLQQLLLSQENLDTPVSSLSLSNDILSSRVRDVLAPPAGPALSDDELLAALSNDVGTCGTPYHHHQNRLRQAFAQNDPDFSQLLAAPQFAKHLNETVQQYLRYDISPALRALLVDQIDENNAQAKFEHYFPGVTPELMMQPERLRSWFGLSDTELQGFMGVLDGGEYQEGRLLKRVGDEVVEFTLGAPSGFINYVRLFPMEGDTWKLSFNLKVGRVHRFDISDVFSLRLRVHHFGVEEIAANTEYSHEFEWKNVPENFTLATYWSTHNTTGTKGHRYSFQGTCKRYSMAAYLLVLNKVVRLYKATGLSQRALLDSLLGVDLMRSDDQMLAAFSRTAQLVEHYGVDHETALLMSKGLLSQMAGSDQKSQFDRLFNDPPLVDGGMSPSGERLYLHPSKAEHHAAIKASLKRACRTDDEGLFELAQLMSGSSLDMVGIHASLSQLSGLYTLSLWARHHGLMPGELRQLLQMMGVPAALHAQKAHVWQQWLTKLRAVSGWLSEHGWTVQDLQLMTRDVAAIPESTEIGNLLNDLKFALKGTQPASAWTTQDLMRVLSPLIASAFNLSGDALAQALLSWADRVKPGGLSLLQVNEHLRMQVLSGPQHRAVVDFSYGLAQMAMIAHACGVTGDMLQLCVDQPQLLLKVDAGGVAELARDARTIMALRDFSDWFKRLPDQTGSGGALLGALKTGNGVSLAQLSMTTGYPQPVLEQAAKNAHAKGDLQEQQALHNWQEIEVISQWVSLANAYGVMPDSLAALLALDTDWATWRQVADAFQAALEPSQEQSVHAATQQPLSRALVGVLGARQNFTVDGLNQHLLLDALNSEQVMASRVGEAIGALQQFIHRTLSAPEDPRALNHGALSRSFFREWARWNASYANWAAAQMLVYYPENYIDPTVRLGQTQAMDDMLQALGQAQINNDTVGDAFHGYLAAFEEVANLETISGYHDTRNADLGKSWFIGRSRDQLHQYWWRTVDEAKRNTNGVLPANAWSAWTKIDLVPKAQGRLIRPVVFRGRLHLGWVERQEQILTRDGQGKPQAWQLDWLFKLAWLRYDGKWSAPIEFPLAISDLGDVALDNLSLFLAAWPAHDSLILSVYDRTKSSVSEVSTFAGLQIFENFSSRPLSHVASYLRPVQHWLDTSGRTGMCADFEESQRPLAENRMQVAAGSRVPERFKKFETSLIEAKVVHVSGDQYSLSLNAQLLVEAWQPRVPNRWVGELTKRYPALASEARAVNGLLRSSEGAFLVRKEGNQFWGYLCVSYARMFAVYNQVAGRIVRVGDWVDAPDMESFVHVQTESGNAMMGRFKIRTGNYPLTLMYLALDEQISSSNTRRLSKMSVIDLLNSSALQDTLIPSQYANLLGKVHGNDVRCRIYSVDGTRSSSTHKYYGVYDLAKAPQKVQFITTANVGNLSQWQTAKEAYHRIEFQFGTGNVRSFTVKVYRDADALKTAIIGTNDEGAQYLASRGHISRLNTLFARELTVKAVSGIDNILNYSTQQIPEPKLGNLVRLTLPAYKPEYHGPQPWAKVWLATSANTRTLLWSGELSHGGKVFADVMLEPGKEYNDQPYFHLETEYHARYNRAVHGHSIMINSSTLTIHRDSNVPTQGKLSKDNVDSVQAFSDNANNEMDFTGANALYFWELFYYTPMMVMQRFLQEERFDLAEQWLKYVFNPAGYSTDGRMWNVRPLQEDSGWNDDPLQVLDPDAIAQNDPMHYKYNVVMRLLDIYIGRGDAAYRKLERDSLSEARVWYQRAVGLLGDAPWTPPANSWDEPMLAQAGIPGKSRFLPEANRVLLGYWDTLRIRQYNLRHNLTLDGQPLSLPLYATPADPRSLLAAAVAAEAGGERSLPTDQTLPALRFTMLLEGARSMAAQLIQFGSTLQGILERQDAEALAGLLATQGAELADSNAMLYQQTLKELAADRVTLQASMDAAILRRDHYLGLYEQNLSAAETRALNLKTESQVGALSAKVMTLGAGALSAIPNIFGLANGGGNYGAILKASADVISIDSAARDIAATRISQEEIYRRRRSEWDFQRKSAEKEIATIQAQLDALAVRETSAQMQLKHLQTQAAHAQAQLALHQGKFTGKAMYSWLRARLASIFYTYYDLTVSRCLMAQRALQWEQDDKTAYLRTGTWNSAWAGLLCGEGLMLALGQMETAWVKWQKREMEVTRTVSLAKLFNGKLASQGHALNLGDAIKALLAGQSVQVEAPSTQYGLALASNGALSIRFGLKAMNLSAGFSSAKLRIRSIAVSLPALLGPYQDVHARLKTNATGLPNGCNECAISHAMQDNGLFNQLNGYPPLRQSAQLLPFEGVNIVDTDDTTNLTLDFAQAKGNQKALLERLSDIILHVQFTVR